MGGFVGNSFVRSDDQAAVAKATLLALRKLREGRARVGIPPAREFLPRLLQNAGMDEQVQKLFLASLGLGPGGGGQPVAFVSPSLGGWVGVYEETLEGASEMSSAIAQELSLTLQTTAISFQIYDGDLLRYCVARNGQVLDQFDSDPGYFDNPVSASEKRALRGNGAVLAEACGRPEAAQQLSRLLSAKGPDPYELLGEIAEVLGIHNAATSHRYLVGGHDAEGGRPEAAQQLSRLLSVKGSDPHERLDEIADVLGIHNAATSHKYLVGGREAENVEGWPEFVTIVPGEVETG